MATSIPWQSIVTPQLYNLQQQSSGFQTATPNFFNNAVQTGGGSSGGGGGGGGYVAPTTNTAQPTDNFQVPAGAPMQSNPQNPVEQVDWNAMYAPAFGAIDQYQNTLQPQYETNIKEIDTNAAQKTAGAQEQQAEKLGAYGLQRTNETARTKSAVAESRRLAAEMMQGIQARFGGTTNAGGAYSEILGSQATRNIATNQSALQYVMAQIGQEETNVRNQTTQYINDLEQQTALDKEKARNTLQAALANVANMRGQLESEKASQKISLLKDYNNTLAQIDAANTSYKQQLYNNWQTQQYQLDQLKAKAVNQHATNITAFNPTLGSNTGSTTTPAPTTNIRTVPSGTTNPDDWTQILR